MKLCEITRFSQKIKTMKCLGSPILFPHGISDQCGKLMKFMKNLKKTQSRENVGFIRHFKNRFWPHCARPDQKTSKTFVSTVRVSSLHYITLRPFYRCCVLGQQAHTVGKARNECRI